MWTSCGTAHKPDYPQDSPPEKIPHDSHDQQQVDNQPQLDQPTLHPRLVLRELRFQDGVAFHIRLDTLFRLHQSKTLGLAQVLDRIDLAAGIERSSGGGWQWAIFVRLMVHGPILNPGSSDVNG